MPAIVKHVKCICCNKFQFVRGLCRQCYNSANTLVRTGVVTWAELEAARLAVDVMKQMEREKSGFNVKFREKFLKALKRR